MQNSIEQHGTSNDILFEPVDFICREHIPAVYLLQNTSGFYYIGATTNLSKRMDWHKACLKKNNHPNKKFQDSYNENPDFYFFSSSVESDEAAFEIEKKLIEISRGDPYFLNLKGVRRAAPPSEEVRKTVSEKSKAYFQCKIINDLTGKTLGEERREAYRNRMLDRRSKEGYSLEISNRLKGHWADRTFREKMALIRKEVANRPEIKAATSLRSKKNWESEEYRNGVVSSINSRWQDPNFKDKMANFFNSPENKERLSKLHKGKVISEETRRKMSESHTRRFKNE